MKKISRGVILIVISVSGLIGYYLELIKIIVRFLKWKQNNSYY